MPKKISIRLGCLLLPLYFFFPLLQAETTLGWNAVQPSSNHSFYNQVITDNVGNVFALVSDPVDRSKVEVQKRTSANGTLLWKQNLTAGSLFALDRSGAILLVGRIKNRTQKYSIYSAKLDGIDGHLVWENIDAPESGALNLAGMCLDSQDNIVVTGSSIIGSKDACYTAKYSGIDGGKLWNVSPVDSRNSYGYGVAVDGDDNVIITGTIFAQRTSRPFDGYTVKYNGATSSVLWASEYAGTQGDDYLNKVSVDANNDIVVVGSTIAIDHTSSGFQSAYSICTIKYAGATGTQIWITIRNGMNGTPSFPGNIAVDENNDVVIVGNTTRTIYTDVYTAKYSGSNGSLLWEQFHDSLVGANDGAGNLAIDLSGNVHIDGYTEDPVKHVDLYLAEYAGSTGDLLWQQEGTGLESGFQATGLAVDASGGTFVIGGFLNKFSREKASAIFKFQDSSELP